MAKLESNLQFTGSLGNLSAYRMRGVDGIVLRRKGGPDKKRIRKDAAFEMTRLNNSEFSGRARAVQWVMSALFPLRRVVADHVLGGHLQKLLKHIQERDGESALGQRGIFFSKHGSLLEGFSMNRVTALESVVKMPFNITLSRETGTAKVDIPELVPELTFSPLRSYPLFQVTAVLGVLPDTTFTPDGYAPPKASLYSIQTVTTEWLHSIIGSPATTLEIKLEKLPPNTPHALVLSVGVCFGTPGPQDVQKIRHVGCGKIVAVA